MSFYLSKNWGPKTTDYAHDLAPKELFLAPKASFFADRAASRKKL
jgi:hypothetical protein